MGGRLGCLWSREARLDLCVGEKRDAEKLKGRQRPFDTKEIGELVNVN